VSGSPHAAPPPAPPGLVDPNTDPLPDPVPLHDGIGRVWRAVEYAAPIGYRPLLLDLYTPNDADTAPVVVFLHGGGWRVGTRRVFCPTWRAWRPDPFYRLVAEGFTVASVDYRLTGEAVFPAQLHDAKDAVRWLRIRADELGIATDPITAWGESAGGHLAALLGLTTGRTDLDAVAAVVDWYGPSDLLSMQSQARADAVTNSDAPDSRESMLIGAPVQEAPVLAREASPMTHVHPGAPPFHLAHGEVDRFIPAAQSRELADALRASGVHVELEIIPDADHMWVGAPDPERIFQAAVDFVRSVATDDRPKD